MKRMNLVILATLLMITLMVPFALAGLPTRSSVIASASRMRALTTSVAIVTETIQDCDGDVNRDGVVDIFDSIEVTTFMGCSVSKGNLECNSADQNEDGNVNPLDSGYVLSRYGVCPL